MSKKKEQQLSFGLQAFQVVDFKLNQRRKKVEENSLGYRFQFRPEFNRDDKIIEIYFKITAVEGKDAKSSIASIETKTDFFIPDFDKMRDGDAIDVPDPLMTTLMSIALSTTRGAMAVKTEGHVIQKFLIPLMNPQAMFNEFVKQNKEAFDS